MKSSRASKCETKPVVVRCDDGIRQMLKSACKCNARSVTSEAKLRIKHHLSLYPDFHNVRVLNVMDDRLYIRIDVDTYVDLLKSKNRSGRTFSNEMSVRLLDHLINFPGSFSFVNE